MRGGWRGQAKGRWSDVQDRPLNTPQRRRRVVARAGWRGQAKGWLSRVPSRVIVKTFAHVRLGICERIVPGS